MGLGFKTQPKGWLKSITDRLTQNETDISSHNHDDRYYSETEIDSKLFTINTAVEEATAIAKGRGKGKVFDTLEEMQTWLKDSANAGILGQSDNLYIRDTGIPDYWVANVLTEPNSDGYYYDISELETQKVDLTEYDEKIAKNAYDITSLNNDLANNYQSKDVVTSTDEYGEIWRLTSTTNVSSVIFKDICYGNGVFVAVGTNGAIYRSSDGDSFSQVGSVSGNFTGVCYGGHMGTRIFIAVGDGGIYRSTDNAITWTVVDTSVTGLKSISYTGSAGWTFVAVGNTNVRKSTDGGITWTTMGYYASFNDICYGGKFVAVGYDNNGGKIYYSNNTGMTLATGYNGGPVYGVCYGNGKYVCVGSGIYYSTDGITWTGVDGDGFAAGKMYGICYGDGTFVVVGADGAIYYSTDGITWNAGSNDRTQLTLNSVCYGNGRFIAVGGDESTSSGYFLYSVYKEYTENLVDMVNALEAAIGSTDISAIGADVKAAISSLNTALANTQTALDNKVTTGTSAKLDTLALAGSKIALVYSEDDNVNFRYKNASGNTSYLNLRNIVSTFDTLTSRGGYTYLAGLYNSTDEATTYKACSTISNYRYLVFVLQYADVRIDVKTIPRAFFVNEVTKQTWALLLKSGNSEAAALLWWDSNSNSIFAFINKSYNVVNVYGIL